MRNLNRNLPPVPVGQFSMVPRQEVPRSTFVGQFSHKTTFGAGWLIPLHVDEVLPGDVHQGKVTLFARLATPLFPIMDNLTLETFFFFVPCRLVWTNWVKMMGERINPSDSINYTMPQVVSPVGGWDPCTLGDYMGLPVKGQMGGAATKSVNAIPLRAYNMIWNEWFRDQNLQSQQAYLTNDGPDSNSSFVLLRRNKAHDYFTSALPWPTKNNDIPGIPIAGLAAVKGIGFASTVSLTAGNPPATRETYDVATAWATSYANTTNAGIVVRGTQSPPSGLSTPEIYADLTTATGVTLNAMRLAIATQRLLEADARGGTRYTEILRNHFGVEPEDARLNRPEYIGGGRSRIETQAIPQTAPSAAPVGNLGAAAVGAGEHEFTLYAKEHGYIIGLVNVRADLTYQQGLHRMWTRRTRYDFYWPAFANLGEQVVRNDELYVQGTAADDQPFGYQERWAEYRHRPSRISGLFRGTSVGTIDQWHLAQEFSSLPVLNSTFIQDSVPGLQRALAAGAAADNQQVLLDSLFTIRTTRAMPIFSVPGLDRF